MNATPFNVNDVEPQVYVYVGLVLITILFLFCLLVIICCKLLQACKRRATDEQHLIQPDSSKRTSTAVLLLPNAPIVQWSGFRTPQPSSVSSGTTGIGPTIHLPTNSENVLNAQPINGKRLNNLFQREYLKAKWPVLGPLSRSPKTHGQSGSNSLSADLIVGRGRDQITRKCLSLHHGRNRNGGSGVSLINSPIVSSMLSSTPLVEFTLHFVSRTNRLLVQINCVRHLQSIVTTNPSDARQMPSIQFKLMLQDSDGRTRGRLFKTNAEPASGGIVIYSEQRAQFPINVPFDRLQQMTLKMIVYLRRVLVSRKQTLGNLLIRLDRPDFESDQVLLLELKLMPVCPLTGRLLQPLVPVGDLGYLKIGLRLARAKPHSKESFQLHLLLQQARALATERKQKSTTNLTESPSDSAGNKI